MDYRKLNSIYGWKATEGKVITLYDQLANPIIVKEFFGISDLKFHPTKNNTFVAVANKLNIYSTDATLLKSISRNKSDVICADYRSDGALLAAGEKNGSIQIFDSNSRAILRSLNGHIGAVNYVGFKQDKTHLVSSSSDKSVRIWDIPSQTSTMIFDEHQDYIKTAALSSNLIISGSYDQTIKIWDPRMNKSVHTWNVGAPVESLQLLPGDGLLAVASGCAINIFDVCGGKSGYLVSSLVNNSKTVTTVKLNGSKTHLLSGSLDHSFKAYSLIDYKVIYSYKYSAPIMSLAMNKNDSSLIIGSSNGTLSIKNMPLKQKTETILNKRRGTDAYFKRGSEFKGEDEDLTIQSTKRKRLAPFDRYLKSFQYKSALDAVLTKNHSPVIVMSMIKELSHRQGLLVALGDRDEDTLFPLLNFILKHLNTPEYSKTLIKLFNIILDMYSVVIHQSPLISDLILKISQKLKIELKSLSSMLKVMGILTSLISNKTR